MTKAYRYYTINLVHQLPFTYTLSSNSGLGNLMETIYFGTQHGRVQICAHVANQVCITGMSNLERVKNNNFCILLSKIITLT